MRLLITKPTRTAPTTAVHTARMTRDTTPTSIRLTGEGCVTAAVAAPGDDLAVPTIEFEEDC